MEILQDYNSKSLLHRTISNISSLKSFDWNTWIKARNVEFVKSLNWIVYSLSWWKAHLYLP